MCINHMKPVAVWIVGIPKPRKKAGLFLQPADNCKVHATKESTSSACTLNNRGRTFQTLL